MSKLANSLRAALERAGLRSSMSISFHHHLRNGDNVLNMVLNEAAQMGARDLTIMPSALFDVHMPLIEHIKSGVVKRIETGYISPAIGRAISGGILPEPVRFRTHGGRPDALKKGRAHIDIAFIAAPACDEAGNLNGRAGQSACGALGYAVSDARYADYVVAVTDNIVKYPLSPAVIDETDVDIVARVDSIGESSGIVSGTTRITRDPVGLVIAEMCARVIGASGYLEDGFSFQTGAGGASLAVTKFLKPIMKSRGVVGGFGLGGITEYMVEMLNEGYFKALMDVQCFDLRAVESLNRNPNHIEVSAARYASPGVKSACVDHLDAVVLGATEIDRDFNVNVHTDSNGAIIGGSGGHTDAAAGAKLTIIAAPLYRARLPVIADNVICKSTTGASVDVLVTQRGIAVNPARSELIERLKAARLPVKEIDALKQIAERITGAPNAPERGEKVIAEVENRDGTIIDRIYSVQ